MGDKFKKGACPPHLHISQMYFASHSNFMQLVPHLVLYNKDLGFSQQIRLLQETKFHQFILLLGGNSNLVYSQDSGLPE